MDLMPADEWQQKVDQFLQSLQWSGPWYSVSAMDGRGTDALCQDIMEYLESHEPDVAVVAPASLADDPFASIDKKTLARDVDDASHRDSYPDSEPEQWYEDAGDQPR